MALDLTGATSEWHVLIEVALTGGTVYYADQHLVLDNGTEYEGRISSMSTLRRTAGALLDPRFGKPSLEIVLHDADSVVRESTDDEEWGNKAVVIKVGNGLAAANYDTLYSGVVRFPGGVSYWDDSVLRFSVDDVRSKDAVVLPASRFDPATYANMETKSQYKPIPLVYGDWRTTAGGGETVPCYEIDSTASNGKFKISSHALKEIEAVYIDGSAITSDCTMDAANGEFTITGSTTYDPDTEVITACVQGATDDGTTSGTLLRSAKKPMGRPPTAESPQRMICREPTRPRYSSAAINCIRAPTVSMLMPLPMPARTRMATESTSDEESASPMVPAAARKLPAKSR